MNYPTIWPQFFSATILNWNHLLKEDEYKNIIIECLKFMVDDKRVEVNAFIIMSNPAGRQADTYHLATCTKLYAYTNTNFFYDLYCKSDKEKIAAAQA